MDPAALEAALADVPDGEPVIVCLQAGNLHSGAFDPFPELVAAAHDRGAWVHVDGAFGLWALASPRPGPLARGVEAADSWATDAHKTLNVTYDCGIVVVRDPVAMRSAMGVHASYLPDAVGPRQPLREGARALAPRARRAGVGGAALAGQRRRRRPGRPAGRACARHRRRTGRRDRASRCSTTSSTPRSASPSTTAAPRSSARALTGSGEVWMSPSRWQDRDVVRVSVSNAATTDDDVRRTVAAVRRAVAG